MQASSFLHCENTVDLWDVFTMFEAVSEHSKCQSLCLCDRFIARASVGENTGQIGHLAEPATVLFALNLYGEIAHV